MCELKNALKPIVELLNKLREEHVSNSVQISEMHAMLTNMSVKMDTIEQTAGATLTDVSKLTVKKTAVRKPAVKPAVRKPPVKRGKKATEDADHDTDVDQDVDQDADADQNTDVDADVDHDADSKAGDSDTDSKTDAKKETAKKLPVKKATTKKAPVKATAPRHNKMVIFKNMYKTDPSKFDKQLTAKVKKQLETENAEALEGLSNDGLNNQKLAIYYKYMAAKHDDILEEIKRAHIASIAEE